MIAYMPKGGMPHPPDEGATGFSREFRDERPAFQLGAVGKKKLEGGTHLRTYLLWRARTRFTGRPADC